MFIAKLRLPYYFTSLALLPTFFHPQEAVAQPSAALMDTVAFANGDQLSGKLVQAIGDSVTFDGKVTKLVTLQWSDIRQIDLPNGTSVFTKGNKPLNGNVAVIRVQGQDLILDPGTANTRTVPIAQLAFVGKPPVSPTRWGSQISTDDSLLVATQHQYQVGATLSLGHETTSEKAFHHQTDEIHLQAAFGESQKPNASPVITRVYEGVVQHDFYLTDTRHDAALKTVYGGPRLFVLTDFYHNLSLGMKLEQAYGGGVAWNGEHGRQRFGIGADIRYIGEDLYSPGKRLNLAASAFSQNYSVRFPLASKKVIIISESGSVIPAYNDAHALQARGIAKITLPLTKDLSIGPSLTDDYLRNAPPKSKQNYLSLKFSLTYALGASAAR